MAPKQNSGRNAGKKAGKSRATVDSSVDALLPKDKLYYRIGEVSEITGVKTYVLRYWESEFRGMVPQKSRSKQRLYKRRDIEMILLIKKLLYEERYTIAGARQRIKELNAAKQAGVAPPDAQPNSGPLDHRVEYARLKQDLQDLRAML